ncbi:MAG: ABC transporter [Acidobacteria bacterium]|nr:MAG: ABC transporter [Acidobacteriota bacterium]
MRNILAMAGKELRAYFHSPIAYVVMTIWTAMTGFAFYLHLWVYTNEIFRMQMMGGMGAPPISLNDVIIRPMLEGFLLVVLLFLTPVITMRLFAEEKRSGSIELLLTSPVTDLEIILGKYAGAFLLLLSLIALTFVYIGLLFIYGNPDPKPVIVGALGMLLFGAALLSIGMWISTFTKNQIIAGAITLAVLLLLYILVWLRDVAMGSVGQLIAGLSLGVHIESFAKGVIDVSDLVYYLSVVFLGVFLTARSVDALKGKP